MSTEEARAQRLAMFDKKKKVADDKEEEKDDGDGDAKMDANFTANASANTSTSTDKNIETNNNEDGDKEMTDAGIEPTEQDVELVEVDPTENLSKEDIATLTESMGFTLIRAQKGLLHSTSGLEGAIEWIMNHQDDANIDDPIPKASSSSSSSPGSKCVPVPANASSGTPAIATSYRCNECGKILSNMANLELHANKTGHSDFEESTEQVKPLTEEQKAQKIQAIKSLLALKRKEREELEKVAEIDREKSRRNDAKKSAKTKEEMAILARKREARLRKKEKEDFKRERARIKAEIEKDKRERAAHKGKLTSKLGIDGYNPDAIQYNVDGNGGGGSAAADGSASQSRPAPKKKGNAAKIDEYIQKISSYKAGGDGGKCLKILILYLKNIVANPTEEKYRKINMDNKVYKTKIKPFIGAKILLLAVGFAPNDGNSALILAEDADMDVLKQTKEKLEKAFSAY